MGFDGQDLPPHKSDALRSVGGDLKHILDENKSTTYSLKVIYLYIIYLNIYYRFYKLLRDMLLD